MLYDLFHLKMVEAFQQETHNMPGGHKSESDHSETNVREYLLK